MDLPDRDVEFGNVEINSELDGGASDDCVDGYDKYD